MSDHSVEIMWIVFVCRDISRVCMTLGAVAKWSKVLTAVLWLLMMWSTFALGTYQLRFVSWVFHVIFSFVHFISLDTLIGLHAFRKPLPYDMYLFNFRIANHILIKKQEKHPYQKQWTWSPQMITMNLLFLCHTTIDWILILMVYVYNLKSLLVKWQYHNLA